VTCLISSIGPKKPADGRDQNGIAPTKALTDRKPQSPNNSRSRLVWARLTGISVCFLSSIRNW